MLKRRRFSDYSLHAGPKPAWLSGGRAKPPNSARKVREPWVAFHAVALCLTLLLPTSASAADVGTSYEAGTPFGTQLQGNDSTVTGFDTSKLPNYNPNPSQTGLFGSASLFQPGADKINACAGYTPGSDKVENQECEAVNFLAKNPSQRIHVSVPAGDPVRSANLESATNPKDVLKRFGMDLDANPGECKDVTQVTDPTYRNETCYEGAGVDQPVCSIGHAIEVDTDANYVCDQTHQAVEVKKCSKKLVVTGAGWACEGKTALFDTQAACASACTVVTKLYWIFYTCPDSAAYFCHTITTDREVANSVSLRTNGYPIETWGEVPWTGDLDFVATLKTNGLACDTWTLPGTLQCRDHAFNYHMAITWSNVTLGGGALCSSRLQTAWNDQCGDLARRAQ